MSDRHAKAIIISICPSLFLAEYFAKVLKVSVAFILFYMCRCLENPLAVSRIFSQAKSQELIIC